MVDLVRQPDYAHDCSWGLTLVEIEVPQYTLALQVLCEDLIVLFFLCIEDPDLTSVAELLGHVGIVDCAACNHNVRVVHGAKTRIKARHHLTRREHHPAWLD